MSLEKPGTASRTPAKGIGNNRKIRLGAMMLPAGSEMHLQSLFSWSYYDSRKHKYNQKLGSGQ